MSLLFGEPCPECLCTCERTLDDESAFCAAKNELEHRDKHARQAAQHCSHISMSYLYDMPLATTAVRATCFDTLLTTSMAHQGPPFRALGPSLRVFGDTISCGQLMGISSIPHKRVAFPMRDILKFPIVWGSVPAPQPCSSCR